MELAGSSFDGARSPLTSELEPSCEVEAALTLREEPDQPFFSLIGSSLLAVHDEEAAAAAAAELHAEPRLAAERAISPAVPAAQVRAPAGLRARTLYM